MTEAIRRLNQIEAQIELIKDDVVREAFSGLLQYFVEQSGYGLETQGNLRGKDIACANGVYSKGGVMYSEAVNTFDGGNIRMMRIQGKLSLSTQDTWEVRGGKVLGAIGWTESTTTSGGVNGWRPIRVNISATRDSCEFIILGSGGGSFSDVVVVNNGTASTLRYKGIIFWTNNDDIND